MGNKEVDRQILTGPTVLERCTVCTAMQCTPLHEGFNVLTCKMDFSSALAHFLLDPYCWDHLWPIRVLHQLVHSDDLERSLKIIPACYFSILLSWKLRLNLHRFNYYSTETLQRLNFNPELNDQCQSSDHSLKNVQVSDVFLLQCTNSKWYNDCWLTLQPVTLGKLECLFMVIKVKYNVTKNEKLSYDKPIMYPHS